MRILNEARKLGITLLDTAYAYGDSEAVLGLSLSAGHVLNIVTKLPPLNKEHITAEDAMYMESCFQESLTRLHQKKVYGLLLHNPDDVLASGGDLLWERMERFKAQGRVCRIGVSVYTEQQIRSVLTRYPLDMVQLPINVLDQRLCHNNVLRDLRHAGVEIHARSVFLQGLLLMAPDKIPPHFSSVKPLLNQYSRMLTANNIQPIEAAFLFIRGIADIDRVIIGVTSSQQLIEIHSAFHSEVPRQSLDFSPYACTDEQIINPSLW